MRVYIYLCIYVYTMMYACMQSSLHTYVYTPPVDVKCSAASNLQMIDKDEENAGAQDTPSSV